MIVWNTSIYETIPLSLQYTNILLAVKLTLQYKIVFSLIVMEFCIDSDLQLFYKESKFYVYSILIWKRFPLLSFCGLVSIVISNTFIQFSMIWWMNPRNSYSFNNCFIVCCFELDTSICRAVENFAFSNELLLYSCLHYCPPALQSSIYI